MADSKEAEESENKASVEWLKQDLVQQDDVITFLTSKVYMLNEIRKKQEKDKESILKSLQKQTYAKIEEVNKKRNEYSDLENQAKKQRELMNQHFQKR